MKLPGNQLMETWLKKSLDRSIQSTTKRDIEEAESLAKFDVQEILIKAEREKYL